MFVSALEIPVDNNTISSHKSAQRSLLCHEIKSHFGSNCKREIRGWANMVVPVDQTMLAQKGSNMLARSCVWIPTTNPTQELAQACKELEKCLGSTASLHRSCASKNNLVQLQVVCLSKPPVQIQRCLWAVSSAIKQPKGDLFEPLGLLWFCFVANKLETFRSSLSQMHLVGGQKDLSRELAMHQQT